MDSNDLMKLIKCLHLSITPKAFDHFINSLNVNGIDNITYVVGESLVYDSFLVGKQDKDYFRGVTHPPQCDEDVKVAVMSTLNEEIAIKYCSKYNYNEVNYYTYGMTIIDYILNENGDINPPKKRKVTKKADRFYYELLSDEILADIGEIQYINFANEWDAVNDVDNGC